MTPSDVYRSRLDIRLETDEASTSEPFGATSVASAYATNWTIEPFPSPFVPHLLFYYSFFYQIRSSSLSGAEFCLASLQLVTVNLG